MRQKLPKLHKKESLKPEEKNYIRNNLIGHFIKLVALPKAIFYFKENILPFIEHLIII